MGQQSSGKHNITVFWILQKSLFCFGLFFLFFTLYSLSLYLSHEIWIMTPIWMFPCNSFVLFCVCCNTKLVFSSVYFFISRHRSLLLACSDIFCKLYTIPFIFNCVPINSCVAFGNIFPGFVSISSQQGIGVFFGACSWFGVLVWSSAEVVYIRNFEFGGQSYNSVYWELQLHHRWEATQFSFWATTCHTGSL